MRFQIGGVFYSSKAQPFSVTNLFVAKLTLDT